MKAILNLHSMAITSILYLCQKVGAINAFVVHFCYFNVSQCARIFEPSSFLSQTRIYCLAMAYCSHTYVCMYACAFADVQYLLFGAKNPLPACQILQFLSIIYDQCIGHDF